MDRCYTMQLAQETLWIHLRGEIDLACRPDLHRLVAVYGKSTARHVVVDLGEVTFFDATGLALIADLHHEAQLREGRTVLRHVPPMPLRVIRIAGMGELVRHEPPASSPSATPTAGRCERAVSP